MELQQCNNITNSSIAAYSWENSSILQIFSTMPNLTLQQKVDWSRLIVQQIHLEHHLIFNLVMKKILGTNPWYKTIAIRSFFHIMFSLLLWWPNMNLNTFWNLRAWISRVLVIVGHKLGKKKSNLPNSLRFNRSTRVELYGALLLESLACSLAFEQFLTYSM